jgi:hypothetical protein
MIILHDFCILFYCVTLKESILDQRLKLMNAVIKYVNYIHFTARKPPADGQARLKDVKQRNVLAN